MRSALFDLKPSLTLRLIISVIHLGAIMCITVTHMPWWVRLVLVVICSSSLWFTFRRSNYFTRMIYHQNKGWQLWDRTGKHRWAQLKKNSFRTRWLVILNFHLPFGLQPSSVLLFPDTMSVDSYRRLLACLINAVEDV